MATKTKQVIKVSDSELVRQIVILSNILGEPDPEVFIKQVVNEHYERNKDKVLEYIQSLSPISVSSTAGEDTSSNNSILEEN